jgi:selenocysteine lyase/cysteine desulfurase
LRPNTRLIAMIHVSNVTGAIQPAEEVGRLAKEHDVWFLLDAAQSLGHLPLSVDELQADLLAAPGHKGLLGPLGTGVLWIAPAVEQQLEPVRQGGTGTQSENDVQPESLPDRYESGNHNVPGLFGLGAGVSHLLERGGDEIRRHERQLTESLLQGLRDIPGVTVYGPRDPARRCGVVSLTVRGYDPREVASLLDASYSIQVRSGLHCAPLMHRALGTADKGGTVRFSVGPFTQNDDIAASLRAIEEIAASSLA